MTDPSGDGFPREPEGPAKPDPTERTPFYIPATATAARPRHTLKHGDTFAVLDSFGDIGASAGGPDGLFDHDTRYLSRFEMLLAGSQPLLLGSGVRDDNLTFTVDLTNPDVYRDGRIVLAKDTLHVVRTTYLWGGTAHQRIHVVNHGADGAAFTLGFVFGCDFSDLFEARGMRRDARGTMSEAAEGDRVAFGYAGLDGMPRRAVLRFAPAPRRLASGAATYEVALDPGASFTVTVAAECSGPRPAETAEFRRGLVAANRAAKALMRGVATVDSSNEVFNEVLRRSTADLYMLLTDTPQGLYPYAGIPWYSTTFGRDGIITALQMLWIDPAVARGVLARLAHFQATGFDAEADAEPGKILHEMRGGEMAALKEVPFGLYYGSIDSTPLFIVLAGLYLERTGDLDAIRGLWPAIERGFAWMDGPGDRDGDGFLEYARADETGLQNQGWKDSQDAVFHADGSLAEGPIALVEVQGYAYAARHGGARMAEALGFGERAAALRGQAEAMRDRFDAAFWCDEIGMYAIALDGAKKPCRVRTSNAAHVLWTGIVKPERAARIAAEVVSPKFLSGWGVRTVAVGEPRYNPMSYHNGSVWPHDNALIAWGLARTGQAEAAECVFSALFAASACFDSRRLPELFCGFRRRRGAAPTLYPVACAPQAWAAGTPFLLLQASLGIEFDPAARAIRFRNPRLPAFLEEITLRDLGFAEAKVDVTLRQVGRHAALRVLRNTGAVQVSMLLD
ncbi:amylo-alpha-1,6-glucosidase [Lichenibacterium minor]|uniref:Amylo-alpha-1,6-glucosidase n=1 Tax=Lichenibacterium minor TaxID=2316528 RepID=A0A4Q2UB37_9HYPH|nr:amylo-alpha-1,6-glucosidase [Lichenibacterium minor]RYC32367.1 amylo-alpha-1,6-glucosidase [Lichenibacterium minor]